MGAFQSQGRSGYSSVVMSMIPEVSSVPSGASRDSGRLSSLDPLVLLGLLGLHVDRRVLRELGFLPCSPRPAPPTYSRYGGRSWPVLEADEDRLVDQVLAEQGAGMTPGAGPLALLPPLRSCASTGCRWSRRPHPSPVSHDPAVSDATILPGERHVAAPLEAFVDHVARGEPEQ